MALVESAVPKSTRYKNKWDYGIFEQWQKEILIKVPNVEVSGEQLLNTLPLCTTIVFFGRRSLKNEA